MSDTRHLISIDELDRGELERLLDRARAWRDAGRNGDRQRLFGRAMAQLFYEPSTRTRCSFELAARRLGADVLTLGDGDSSAVKGETVADTGRTLAAMGVSLFVIRHRESGVPALLASALPPGLAVLSAGESHVGHPTQALLDLLTLRDHFPDWGKLRIAIVGDVRHSRVSASNLQGLRRLGVNDIRLVGPPSMLPETPPAGTRCVNELAPGIEGADVIMCLRVQRERMADAAVPDPVEFHREWGLTEQRIAKHAPHARVMHPGPMNRGVELSDEVADGPRSLIREQVANGVPARMAALEWLDEINGGMGA
jgi:aspartate carbamoyltransferase catalytic subunit